MMKLLLSLFLAIAIIFFASCTSLETTQKSKSDTNQATLTSSPEQVESPNTNAKIVMSQTIYVPIYPHVYFETKHVLNLAVTLSIRNTDLTHPITITSVRYFDSEGKLVKQYLEKSLQIGALASTNFLVVRSNTSDGMGPNFIIEWIAHQTVSEPIVEAVMIGNSMTDGFLTKGVSFVIPGKVIKSQVNQ